MALTVTCVGSLREVDALRREWQALAAVTPEATAFQSFAWCRAWLSDSEAASGPARSLKPRVVTVREDGRLVMLWPLQQLRFAGLRLVGWIGEPMTQYGDILAEPGSRRPVWRAAAEAQLRGWRIDLAILKRQREDGVLAACGAGDPARWMIEDGDGGSAPFLALEGPAAEATLAAQVRGLRRRGRRLAVRGEVRFSAPIARDERAALVGHALRLKGEWLKARRLYSSGLSHPLSHSFLERLARDGVLATAVLTVGGEVAAVELGLSDAGAYRSLLAAYDLRFADGAPGHVLTTRLVAAIRDAGASRFDFLAPADPYKDRWASGEVRLRTSALALTRRGRLALIAYRLRPLAKRGLREAMRWLGRVQGYAARRRERGGTGLKPQAAR